MADGPRCKRRKQANPRRNNVTSYNNVVEANSDSDDEDRLHIVEEENVPDDSTALDDEAPVKPGDPEASWDDAAEGNLGPKRQPQGGRFKVKDECPSEGEEDCGTDAMVEEILQQGDTAIIYPEAPEDEPRQGTPEAGGHDENGTPDAFSQLLTCPYCSRGYKRYTSLKEHIKYRHEKSEDNFSCSLCSYTFTHRTQLDRHMTAHKSGREQRHVTSTGGNRKFKCTECGKAFKYKHHLKEHLRIHSGEKPYECSNCKKRFSHSGSYSSHISSKKCIGLTANGRPRPGTKGSRCASPALPASPSAPPTPARMQLREKMDNGRALQEQLPLNQIKSEPVDYEYKPVVLTSGVNGVFNGGGAPLQAAVTSSMVQAVVLPTVGLVSPISINLSDIQNVLKVAVDGNIIRQVLGNAQVNGSPKVMGATGQAQPGSPSVISAISLPIVDQDGTAKIIINYNLDPGQAQHAIHGPKEADEDMCKAEKFPEDLTVKVERGEQMGAEMEKDKGKGTCLLCNDCPASVDTLDEMKSHKTKGTKINGAGPDKTTISSLLADGGLSPGQPPLKNLLSLLKAYYALNAEPTKEELVKISDSVSLPLDVVKKWFEKMHTDQIPIGGASPPPGQEAPQPELDFIGAAAAATSTAVAAVPRQERDGGDVESGGEPVDGDGPGAQSPSSPSPMNLSAGAPTEDGSGEEPLDLSLPKLPRRESADGGALPSSIYSIQEEPLNLTCAKKEIQKEGSPAPVRTPPQSAKAVNLVTTQLPTIVAIADRSNVPSLRALSTSSKTILIPQLAYSYPASGSSPAAVDIPQKTAQASGSQEDTSSVDDQNDSDATPPRKRMRKMENGMYACDLCDKIFQKSSSLLRHKYEHTGKRPHECSICSKAFKHKHHLIEHSRLHSGEKPYRCDKCGKRFSHSGSYSQHMNHRYSYCKKEAQERGDEAGSDDATPPEEAMAFTAGSLSDGQAASSPLHLDSDERESSTREDEESEEDEEEEDSVPGDGIIDEDEIRVVRVGEEDEGTEKAEEPDEEMACRDEEVPVADHREPVKMEEGEWQGAKEQ
ncbi:LOW QUALITY PROTEIN: zinc finger E-box-binding homeobox 1-like [Brienomyrus brachyistius]|uniref:LOW QUALITY PROTEIN: zinc finger E-box-binding homeobox 1-like n=1 Tax=Brienomyrus brachyistius TaxID=42636 RepID=UPI0020B45155|nr:LOW QUALITY PROTEIN: zinc finger E-box-binding homeobox 1-like [Brienomyrus brachyistius]